MAQRLLLEGLDPSAILQRAHEDFGPGVSVVQAERIRTGGVLGFFTRETYALTLEVPDGAVPATGASAEDALMAQEIADVEQARRELCGMHAGAESPVRADRATAFDAALTSITAGTDAAEAHGRAFAPARFPIVDASGVTRRDATTAEAVEERRRPPVPAVSARRDGGGSVAMFDRPAAAAGVMLHSWGVQHESVQAATLGPRVADLLRLGVPAPLLPERIAIDARVPLHHVVAGLAVPKVHRLAPGSVLLIVGEAAAAFRVATQMAFWAQVPTTDVVLAGLCPSVPGHGRRVLTPASAARTRTRAEQAAAKGAPLIIALGAAPGQRGAEAAAPLAAAFGADRTWAAVDASRHDPHRNAELSVLRGRAGCEAIAAVGLSEAQAPASVLTAPLPVSWLDGVPASPVAWAALLGERIADAEADSAGPHLGGSQMSGGFATSR
ncbi:hypothetical protein [Demequina aestuarii]|uniref:hypothetical protein n=1 Tax=Demequina aestuarii TaxID=327095 RepID=UPI00078298CF|nr:hypothetical protein [Demequina aestuarii]